MVAIENYEVIPTILRHHIMEVALKRLDFVAASILLKVHGEVECFRSERIWEKNLISIVLKSLFRRISVHPYQLVIVPTLVPWVKSKFSCIALLKNEDL